MHVRGVRCDWSKCDAIAALIADAAEKFLAAIDAEKAREAE